jgi:hypothetical protein
MRRLASLAIVLVAFGMTACNAPPMKEYAYPAWGFAASFWSPPKVTDSRASGSEPHYLLVESEQAGRQFAVYAGEGLHADATIDAVGPDAAQRFAKAMGGEVGPMTYASTAAGVLGREFEIDRNGKPYAAVRVFIANGRFYEVGAQSVLGPDDPAAKDFLDSFRITAAPRGAPPPISGQTNAAPGDAASTNVADLMRLAGRRP